jgi:glycosyltransferase involved in cell wall biosynthesis
MRIAFVTEYFAEKMGYAENFLPKAIASLGAEVHVIASNLQPYFNSSTYQETYEPFLGPGIMDCGKKELDGYTLHRLPHKLWHRRIHINGLLRRVWEIKPQVVQAFSTYSPSTFELAMARPALSYKLFLESHIHASVFPSATHRMGIRSRLFWLAYAITLGPFVSLMSEKNYPISQDAADIVIRFFGYQKSKVNICSLGVDTELFKPANGLALQEARKDLRRHLGFSPDNIVCIYTGRFTEDKGPLILAKAVSKLSAQGYPLRGLFVGNGQKTILQAIKKHKGCIVHSFVPVQELAQFYRAADIGVWPKQESLSQLDAIACGLPIILSYKVKVLERIDGNGLVYKEGDPDDLAEKIRILFNVNTRKEMGELGAKKMKDHFSWNRIAEERLRDYEWSLGSRKNSNTF